MAKTTMRSSKAKFLDRQADKAQLRSEILAAIDLATDEKTKAYLKKQLEKVPNTGRVNSKKTVYNGQEFDSTREALFARLCDENSLDYVRQVNIVVMESFKLHGKTVRPIELNVDFLVEGFAFVDVKGIVMPDFKLKWKMLKNLYRDDYEYYLPSSDKEVRTLIHELLSKSI